MTVKRTVKRARRAGADRKRPAPGRKSAETRKKAGRDLKAGQSGHARPKAPRRSRAASEALKQEPTTAASAEAPSAPAATAVSDRRIKAPGKQHRLPPPSEHGVRHSNQMIAKARLATFARRPGRG